MFDVYEKSISNDFAGRGTETIVVREGIIQAHTRAWNNPSVIDETWEAPLKHQPVKNRGKGWRRLRGQSLQNCQAWAADVV